MYFMSDRATVGDGTGGAVLACHREAVSDAGFRDYSMYGISLRSEIALSFPEHAAHAAPDVTFCLKSEAWFAGVTSGIPDGHVSDWWFEHADSDRGRN